MQGVERRVVVTGIGLVTPLGIGTKESWQAAIAGKSGVGPITRFDAKELPSRIAGEVKNFDPAQFMDKKEARRNDLFIQFGLAATDLARSEEHTSELQSRPHLVCRLLLEKKKKK